MSTQQLKDLLGGSIGAAYERDTCERLDTAEKFNIYLTIYGANYVPL